MASAACPARSRAPLPRSVDPVSADNAQPVCAPRQCRWLAFPAINPPASCLRSSAYATVTFGISFRLNGDRTPLARPRQKDIPIPARPRAHTPLGEAVSPTEEEFWRVVRPSGAMVVLVGARSILISYCKYIVI